ncbi:E3 ubiquitin-protein ligase PUB24-like [Impatiens glandulifera]|uniref:E3 ubiquitin-protein ligase PUB24-like n=1 Tax=Impatiens glandulifera TaxID=253017 RepID=UPI001FB099A0|nr:E3 ubiquitin-protein ligase PUB24-like [Impatiens glandulifera]
MEDLEVPQYFICPISLEIMKDPVTTISGITYDRESIEQWFETTTKELSTCPVTKQVLPRDTDLTPNHTLRRLIQAWCVVNAIHGVERIPTPRSPLCKSIINKLVRDLNVSNLYFVTLKKMEEFAKDNERNRAIMLDAGVVKAMVMLLMKFSKERITNGISEVLKILHLVWSPTTENKQLVRENHDFIDSLVWVMRVHGFDKRGCEVSSNAMLVLKSVIEVASTNLLERLKLDFFIQIVKILRVGSTTTLHALKAVLQILIEVSPWGRNRLKIIESRTVFDLIELELNHNPDTRTTELVFCLLAQLCSCADGRAQLLEHGAGLAMVAKRTLRVSLGTDDRSIHILSLVAKFSASSEVLMEMLRVGAVSKLCMVLQADTTKFLKSKAREVLRLHSKVWNNSPCIAVYLMTRDPR